MKERVLNFINGKFIEPAVKSWLPLYNPATGAQIGEVADSSDVDLSEAVTAAEKAFPAWSKTSERERAKILRRCAELIERNLSQLAELETANTGKPISVSRSVDIPRAAQNFEFFADAITQFASEAHPNSQALNYTLRQPLGVVACISPWNLPLYLFTWKITPALAAGNAVVAKPSEITPLTANFLAKLCNEAGLPAGVLNIVHGRGPGIGSALCAHPNVRAISFTGSSAVGKGIAANAGPSLKKVSLELGGKNATLVFADANYNASLETALRSSFSNQGQICLCGSRLLIEESIYEKFKTDFVARCKTLRQGDPMDSATEQGSLVSKAHFEKVVSAVARAQKEGGTILCGGKAPPLKPPFNAGCFYEPTVIENLSPNTVTNQEEIFGPVVTLQKFKGAEEAIALANNSPYGLAASIFTNDITKAHQVAARLQTGIVWINTWMLRDLRTPFGGSKASGLGREGGFEALRFFTETKNICVGLAD